MPRYSYVVAFPVLIAICVGVNIQRYPAVSAMLRGESVESRWLGRSGVFDFQANQTAESKSYQGYRSDSDHVADSRTSRTPIPLSDSLSTPASFTPSPISASVSAASQSVLSSRSTPASQSGSTNGGMSSGANTKTGTSASATDPDNGSYDSDFSRSRSGNRGSTGSTGGGLTGGNSTGGSSTESGSWGRDGYSRYGDPYESRPPGGGSNGLTNTYSSSFDPYDNSSGKDSYSDSYTASRASLVPAWNEDRGNDNQPKDRNDGMNNVGDRSESRTSSDHRSFRPDDYDPGNTGESPFRKDSPLPGYSSRYPVADDAVSSSVTSVPATTTTTASNDTDIAATTVAETEPAVPQARRPLSTQEKLELRLATPFSLSPAGSQQEASSDRYIPPDFLPPHENGIVGKLVNPSAEPVVTISPVTFVSETTPNTTSSVLPETATTFSDTEEGGGIMP